MKFTLSWLNEYIDTQKLSAAQIADKLTMLGLEVDSVTPLFADLEDFTTARVTEVAKHPDADKLTVCTVSDTVQQHLGCAARRIRFLIVVCFDHLNIKIIRKQL